MGVRYGRKMFMKLRPCGKVEQEQSVERERNGGVVDEGDVEVSLARVPVAVVVESVRLQADGDDGHDRFHDAELNGGK